jgi:hypothetical protein
MGDFSADFCHQKKKKKKKKIFCAFVCVFLDSKVVAKISSLESLLVVCVCLSQRDLRRSSSVESTRFVRSLRCGQHGLMKSGDFIVFEGHGYPLVYNILGVCPFDCGYGRPPWG